MKNAYDTTGFIVITGLLVIIFICGVSSILKYEPSPYYVEYKYDSKGNMIREEDNKGKVIEKEYDFKGLLIKEKHYIQK